MLAAVSYALASYPFAFALIMSWANPLMVERTSIIPMTLAHMVFGVVLGAVYLALRPAPSALLHERFDSLQRTELRHE